MAESIARKRASDIIEPSSAGLYPLGHVVQRTTQTLLANGYPADELSSKPLRRELLDDADLIINMTGLPAERVFGDFAEVEQWEVEDPYAQEPATYQRVFVDIESRVLSLANRLRADQLKTDS